MRWTIERSSVKLNEQTPRLKQMDHFMSPNRLLRLGLVLACVVAHGCASAERLPMNTPEDRSYAAKAEDEKHAQLERELSLYSD